MGSEIVDLRDPPECSLTVQFSGPNLTVQTRRKRGKRGKSRERKESCGCLGDSEGRKSERALERLASQRAGTWTISATLILSFPFWKIEKVQTLLTLPWGGSVLSVWLCLETYPPFMCLLPWPLAPTVP